MAEERRNFKFESVGAQTVGAGKDRWQATGPGDITNFAAVVGTAPTGADLILDVLKNGVSIYTTAAKPRVVIGAVETADATSFAPDANAARFAKGDTFSLSVTQIGSVVAGADVDATVEYVGV